MIRNPPAMVLGARLLAPRPGISIFLTLPRSLSRAGARMPSGKSSASKPLLQAASHLPLPIPHHLSTCPSPLQFRSEHGLVMRRLQAPF